MSETNTPADPFDLDSLLDLTPDELAAVEPTTETKPEPVAKAAPVAKKTTKAAAPVAAPAEPAETDAQRRIRELTAQLEAPAPVPVAAAPLKPVTEAELSPEEQHIRKLEDQLARKTAAELEAAADVYATNSGGETIVIHFVTHGFTAQGQIWQRGQELEFEIGGAAYEQTLDRNGFTWLSLRDDVAGQYAKWGREYFRSGPWPGRKIDEINGLTNPEDIADLRALADAERSRKRAAPVVR